MSSEPVTVFFSYSHEDEALRDELAKHLEILKWNGDISTWHDRQILPGDEWDREIKINLNAAQIILLLVSKDFIASKHCHDVEMTRAIERHEAGEVYVIPVILRSCMWSLTRFGKLQALPKNRRPVIDETAWPTLDDAFTSVAEGIKEIANIIQHKYKAKRKARLDQYKATYQKAIQKEYPLSEDTQTHLNDLQESLELSDSEIAPVVTGLLAQYVEGKRKLDQYRQEVRNCLKSDGINLSQFSRSCLEIFRESYGLTPEEANAVIQEELQPYREQEKAIAKHEEAKKIYSNLFSVALEHEYPLGDLQRRRLQEWQNSFGLTNKEAQAIEISLLKIAEKQWQEKQRIYKRQFQEEVGKSYPLEQTIIENLRALQQQLGLSDEVVSRIETPIRESVEQEWQEKQHTYERQFQEVVDKGYPLEQTAVENLRTLQQLGLSDEVVSRIEAPIRESAEQEWQEKQRIYERQFQEVVDKSYPLEQTAVENLRALQQQLGLSNEVVSRIEAPIREKKKRAPLSIKSSAILISIVILGVISVSNGRAIISWIFPLSLSKEIENKFPAGLQKEISWGNNTLLSEEDFGSDNKNPEIFIRNANNEIFDGGKCDGKSYTVAVPVPADGKDPRKAAEMLRGFAHAQAEVNNTCGINGKGLTLLIVDDGDDAEEQAIKVSQAILSLENILAVVGHWTSNVSLAAAEVYKNDGLVLVTPISIADNLGSYPYAFRMNPVSQDGATALSSYLLSQDIELARIIHAEPNKYSVELRDKLEADFRFRLGSSSSEHFDNYFEGGEIKADVKNKLRSLSDNETALVLFPSIDYSEQAFKLIDEIGRIPLDLFLVGDMANLYTTEILNMNAARGMVLAVSWHFDDPKSKRFSCDAHKLWGGPVNHATAMSYNAIKAVVEAMKKSRSPDRQSVYSTLNSADFSVEGVSGEFTFDKNRVSGAVGEDSIVRTPVQLVQVRGPREGSSSVEDDFGFTDGRTSGSESRLAFVPLGKDYVPLPPLDVTDCPL